eukprot:m.59873 g.59873  ORF g.59873 m.59873 type:complete len:297 (+) comp34903_c0_seq2:592-1482(+)
MGETFIAGSFGGLAGIIIGHPFDTVKVRLQTQSFGGPKYRGMTHCFSSIIRQESMSGLYKGMASPVLGFMAVNSLVFGVYGKMMNKTSSLDHIYLRMLVAGSTAGLVQTPIASVVELVKTRLQIQGKGERKSRAQRNYTGPLDCLVKIYQKEGIVKGVFRGMGTTALRDSFSFGCYFASYEFFHRLFPVEFQNGVVGGLVTLVGGGFAGCVAWLVSYPFDVVKSRLQADGVDLVRYHGMADCFRKSYQAEGWRVFTKGLGSALARAFPVNAATFAAVEVYLFFIKGKGLRVTGQVE